jgi:hypothetical protein
MVYAPNDERNQSLVQKRIKDPAKWSWAKLGEHFAVHRSVAKQIFERDMEKFAMENEIDRYLLLIDKKKWPGTHSFSIKK